MSTTALALPRRFASLVKFEHTVFALPFAYVGAFLAVDGYPGHVDARLDHARDGRRADARDGAEPARRCRARRPQPAHGRPRDPGRRSCPARQVWALCAAALALYLVAAFQLEPDRPLALADSGRDVRRLPVPQARHVALPPLARRLHGPRAARRLARGDGLGAVGGVGALRRAGPLGGGLRPLLLALRPRARPRGGPALVGDAVRRAGRLRGRPRLPRRRRRAARRGRRRASAATSSTGSASPRSPACSSTSTRSSVPATSAGSMPRSSPSTASSASSSSSSSSSTR